MHPALETSPQMEQMRRESDNQEDRDLRGMRQRKEGGQSGRRKSKREGEKEGERDGEKEGERERRKGRRERERRRGKESEGKAGRARRAWTFPGPGSALPGAQLRPGILTTALFGFSQGR